MNNLQLRKLDLLLSNTGDMCLKRRAKLLISKLNPQKKDRILDAGCGDGYYLYLLSHLGRFNLTGIDEGKININNAKRQVNDKNIKYFEGDILKMPFKSESFNKIVLSEVLEHVSNDFLALKEIKRVLIKNGRLFVTVPNINYPFFWDPLNWILQHFFKTHVKSGFWAGVWNMHDRLYSVPELKKVVEVAGFKIEEIITLTHYGLPFNHYLTNLGFRIRTSHITPQRLKQSITKFAVQEKKSWFSKILDYINRLDKRNDKKFSQRVSTVGIFLMAKKMSL